MGETMSKLIPAFKSSSVFEDSITPKRPDKVRILQMDPRSPTSEIIRTPIEFKVTNGTPRRFGSCSNLCSLSSTPRDITQETLESLHSPDSATTTSTSVNTCSDPDAPLIRRSNRGGIRRTSSVPTTLHRRVLQRYLDYAIHSRGDNLAGKAGMEAADSSSSMIINSDEEVGDDDLVDLSPIPSCPPSSSSDFVHLGPSAQMSNASKKTA